MKKSYIKNILVVGVFFCLLFMMACEKDANVKLPKVEPKIVVVSFIAPQDSLIKVHLSLSQPLYNTSRDNAYKPLENANVSISSIYGTKTLLYNSALKCYVIDSVQLKVRSGLSYILSVTTADGKNALATTTIPELNSSLKTELTETGEWGDYYSVRATWEDPAGQDNYYRLFLENSSYYLYYSGGANGTYEDTVYTKGVLAELTDDLKKPGGTLSSSYPFSFQRYDASDNYFCLLHVSKEYYDYHNRLYNASNTGNPFSEPVRMPTNVQGGFGIFSGYNMYRVKLEP